MNTNKFIYIKRNNVASESRGNVHVLPDDDSLFFMLFWSQQIQCVGQEATYMILFNGTFGIL